MDVGKYFSPQPHVTKCGVSGDLISLTVLLSLTWSVVNHLPLWLDSALMGRTIRCCHFSFGSLVHWQVCLQQQGLVWMTWGGCVSCDSASWRGGGPTTPGRASNTRPAGWRFTCTALCSFWMRCCTLCLWQTQGLLIKDQDHVQIQIWILWMCTHWHMFSLGQICYLIDTQSKLIKKYTENINEK